MSAMAAAAYRTEGEVAGQRALAEVASGQTPYRQTAADAVTRTLDWVTGQTLTAPVSGDELEPSRDAVRREMVLAGDLERRALQAGADSTWLGKVAHTLSWWRCEPYTEPPLL